MGRLFTVLAYDKRLSLFNSQQRNKKQTKVVIYPFVRRLIHTADRAPPGVLVQYLRFGRYAGYKDHVTTRKLPEYWRVGLTE